MGSWARSTVQPIARTRHTLTHTLPSGMPSRAAREQCQCTFFGNRVLHLIDRSCRFKPPILRVSMQHKSKITCLIEHPRASTRSFGTKASNLFKRKPRWWSVTLCERALLCLSPWKGDLLWVYWYDGLQTFAHFPFRTIGYCGGHLAGWTIISSRANQEIDGRIGIV